jgi:hypothetical protein
MFLTLAEGENSPNRKNSMVVLFSGFTTKATTNSNGKCFFDVQQR